MGKSSKIDSELSSKILERIIRIETKLDTLLNTTIPFTHNMCSDISYIKTNLEYLKKNKPWLFKSERFHKDLSQKQLSDMDKENFKKNQIRELEKADDEDTEAD